MEETKKKDRLGETGGGAAVRRRVDNGHHRCDSRVHRVELISKDREITENAMRERMQATETNVRIYTEPMSRREEAESALSKRHVRLDDPVLPEARAGTLLDEKVLNLELLAYNFHESLNLKPLFLYIDRQIRASGDPARKGVLREAPEGRSRDHEEADARAGGRRHEVRPVHRPGCAQGEPGRTLRWTRVRSCGRSRQRYFSLFVQEADLAHRGAENPDGDKNAERHPRERREQQRRILDRILRFSDDRQYPARPRPAVRGGPERI
ncbi:MAG: hypothetical protein MZU97_07080 [Bacillus subtilis]|nr:hypothetical protein [Bacillus subtilis]